MAPPGGTCAGAEVVGLQRKRCLGAGRLNARADFRRVCRTIARLAAGSVCRLIVIVAIFIPATVPICFLQPLLRSGRCSKNIEKSGISLFDPFRVTD